jgi:hypothetical protein
VFLDCSFLNSENQSIEDGSDLLKMSCIRSEGSLLLTAETSFLVLHGPFGPVLGNNAPNFKNFFTKTEKLTT